VSDTTKHAPSPADVASLARTRPTNPEPTVQRSVEVTGAQSLVLSLEAVGADTVFGIPGGAILPA
jgi:acetolactate synthase-1/2/3 large subunit